MGGTLRVLTIKYPHEFSLQKLAGHGSVDLDPPAEYHYPTQATNGAAELPVYAQKPRET